MNAFTLYQLFLTLIGSSLGTGIVTHFLTSRSQRTLQHRQQKFEEQSRREREEHERSLQHERVFLKIRLPGLSNSLRLGSNIPWNSSKVIMVALEAGGWTHIWKCTLH